MNHDENCKDYKNDKNDKLEIASSRIVALQQELREIHEKHREEIENLKCELQKAQKIAADAESRRKRAQF